ncbi:glycosyltransferase family 2 protein [Psychrobacter immobilis]|uniref:glycosyltransferase family 2 protein n=1 Tax=Psychrobacter immobilis TaxID=498 RepID=UPI00191B2E33|nr:glycosyltransferase family 2 protein [Psychrobacter immobilis]
MFSIVIPLYNKELSIENTIHSVLNQCFQDFEVLVVNDGSTDNSVNVVEQIIDARIRLITQTNLGVSAARNRGITEAQFDWIAFLDGDDLWFENHLEEVANMITAFPAENFFTTSFIYSDDRKLFKHKRNSTIFKVESYFKESIKETLLSADTIVINKKCFKCSGLFNIQMKSGEDTELWDRMVRQYGLVKSDTVTAIYRVEAENRTTLSKDLETTYVYNVDLSQVENTDEQVYFKEMIANMLYQYLRTKDFYHFNKLKKKHSKISYITVLKYSTKHIVKRVFERIPIK